LLVNLRSPLRDMALIVTSILIAFFLDAWWDDQIEQKGIEQNLHAVYADFVSTRDELTGVLDANATYVENVTELISLNPDDIVSLDAQRKTALTDLLPRGGLTFDPVLGSIEALISSGQLNRVRSSEVRSLIGEWPALMDEIGEDQQILIDTYMASQERSVGLGIYLLSLRRELDGDDSSAQDEILARVLQDVEMLNRLAAHRFATKELDRELEEIHQHLDRILQVLHAELGIDGAH